MKKDILFLIQPGFEDPAYPGERFYLADGAETRLIADKDAILEALSTRHGLPRAHP